MRWDGMEMEVVLVVVMMMIDLDDARDDGDDDGDDLPFREVFSPTESARRKGHFFSVGFCHRAEVELRKLLSL